MLILFFLDGFSDAEFDAMTVQCWYWWEFWSWLRC